MLDNEDKKQSLIQFPCYFPIKIVGTNTEKFINDIKDIVFTHFTDEIPPQLNYKFSNNQKYVSQKYVSITANVYVHNQNSLDNLYQKLTKHPEVKMVL